MQRNTEEQLGLGLKCDFKEDMQYLTRMPEAFEVAQSRSNSDKSGNTTLKMEDIDFKLTLQDELFKPLEDQKNEARMMSERMYFTQADSNKVSDSNDDSEESLIFGGPTMPKTNRTKTRALKICGTVAVATVGLPLITGAGMATVAILTAAGTMSPPVLVGMKMYKKYTSNPWWTYLRKKIRLAVARGAIIGTVCLPLLAPWGVYKLFRGVANKIKKAKFHRKPRKYKEISLELLDEGNDDNNQGLSSKSERCQLHHNEANFEVSVCPTRYDSEVIEQSEMDASQLIRLQKILNPIGDTEDEELSECDQNNLPLCSSLKEGREAFSDEENDYGRKDNQQEWIRRALSDGYCREKVSDATFKSVLDWREEKRNKLINRLRCVDSKIHNRPFHWPTSTNGGVLGKNEDYKKDCCQIQDELCPGSSNGVKKGLIASYTVVKQKDSVKEQVTNKPEGPTSSTFDGKSNVREATFHQLGHNVQEEETTSSSGAQQQRRKKTPIKLQQGKERRPAEIASKDGKQDRGMVAKEISLHGNKGEVMKKRSERDNVNTSSKGSAKGVIKVKEKIDMGPSDGKAHNKQQVEHKSGRLINDDVHHSKAVAKCEDCDDDVIERYSQVD